MIAVEGLRFGYPAGGFRLTVPALAIAPGATVAIHGASGSGKSTLLALLSGILVPDAGRIEVDGQAISTLPDAARRAIRLSRIGMVFQDFALIDYLTVEENVLAPAGFHGGRRAAAALRDRARDLIATTGLGHRARARPGALSQGERQRVAIARALLLRPAVILADEATGNLDPVTAGQVLDLLFAEAAAIGATLVAVTHDHGLLPRFGGSIDFATLCEAGLPERVGR